VHVLITGGAGFIGSHLAEYHLKKGDKIHVVDNLSTGSTDNILPFNKSPNFRFDKEDILLWNGLEKAVAWADRVYHMAAVVGVFRVLEEPIKVLSTNIAGCERLLRCAYSSGWNPQIIIASSAEVYGNGLPCRRDCYYRENSKHDETHMSLVNSIGEHLIQDFQEDMEPMVGSSSITRWNYSISKLADEAFGLSYSKKFDMNVTVARIFNNVVPRQSARYGMVVPRLIKQAVSGSDITVFGDGSQSRCFCDVRDTTAALDLLANNSTSTGEIVNVGNDREVMIRDLARMVKDIADSDSQIKYIPYHEAYVEQFEDTYIRKPNLEKFFRLTGYKHEWTLEKTLEDLIERERRSASKEKEMRV